jgi:hypothetical protein
MKDLPQDAIVPRDEFCAVFKVSYEHDGLLLAAF